MSGISNLSTMFGATGGPVKSEALEGSRTSIGTSTKPADDAALTGAGDRTVVSGMAGGLAQAMETSDVRSDKVTQLQAAIANGSYNVSSAAVADKLMQTMLGGS